MLTIQNIHKLKNRPLNKRNFYVESINERFDMDGKLLTQTNHRYIIGITDRTYAIQITLYRNSAELHNQNVYTLHSSTGHKLYITKSDITNMDKFIDKLRLVALSK